MILWKGQCWSPPYAGEHNSVARSNWLKCQCLRITSLSALHQPVSALLAGAKRTGMLQGLSLTGYLKVKPAAAIE